MPLLGRRKVRRAAATVAAGAVLVLAASLWTAARADGAPPPLSVTMARVTSQQQPAAPDLSWPDVREAAATVSGFSQTWQTSGQEEVPIASLTKMMTAYLVLKDHPLSSGEQGPRITVTASDVAAYEAGIPNHDSSVAITDGEKITERQALEALLLPSADDIAWLLAAWDAGGNSAFTAKMNAQARALGMNHTDYTDPAGLADSTVSTAYDQLILVSKAMKIPAFTGIVSLEKATIPVQGTINNVNTAVGQGGVIGVKTGSTSQALGCWAFAIDRYIAGSWRPVYGVVLGAPGTLSTMVSAALTDGQNLAEDVSLEATENVTVLPAGTVVGHLTTPWPGTRVPLVTTRPLTGLALAGSRVSLHVADSAPDSPVANGQRVGAVTVDGLISGTTSTPVVAQSSSGKPPFTWRLFGHLPVGCRQSRTRKNFLPSAEQRSAA